MSFKLHDLALKVPFTCGVTPGDWQSFWASVKPISSTSHSLREGRQVYVWGRPRQGDHRDSFIDGAALIHLVEVEHGGLLGSAQAKSPFAGPRQVPRVLHQLPRAHCVSDTQGGTLALRPRKLLVPGSTYGAQTTQCSGRAGRLPCQVLKQQLIC